MQLKDNKEIERMRMCFREHIIRNIISTKYHSSSKFQLSLNIPAAISKKVEKYNEIMARKELTCKNENVKYMYDKNN